MKPRLEITWARSTEPGYDWLATYELVLPVRATDIRDEEHRRGFLRIPMGATRRGGSQEPIDKDGNVETPFRDGCHIRWDAAVLGLEAWAVYGDRRTQILLEP